MLGISGTELVIILFFAFLIFGPEKLPQMGRTVGRAIRQFRDASEVANKKFKEEVADPFQEAIAPYKETIEESAGPLREDIDAINSTINETKSMISDPFKDMFKTPAPEKKAAAGMAVSGGIASDPIANAVQQAPVDAPASSNTDAAAQASADPFAGVFDDDAPVVSSSSSAVEPKPIPEAGGTVVVKKKSLASSLYGLDDEPVSAGKDGE